jgi:chitin synthase
MYLAEDRIMCLELYCKKDCNYRLKYIPNANATVDPVKNVANLTGQRKRWLNGTWFALSHVLSNVCMV